MQNEQQLQQLIHQLQQQSTQFQHLQQQIANLQSQIDQQAPEVAREQRRQNTEFYAEIGMRAPRETDFATTDEGPTLAANAFRDGRYTPLQQQLDLLPTDRYVDGRLGTSAITKSKQQFRKPTGGITTAGSIDPWIKNISEEVKKSDAQLLKIESSTRDILRISLPIDSLLANAIAIIETENEPDLGIITELITNARNANQKGIELINHCAADIMFQRRKAIGEQQRWSSAIKESAAKAKNSNP